MAQITGPQLRAFRRFMEVSQDEVASKIGTSQQSISNLEKRDYVPISTINKYLQAMGFDRPALDAFINNKPAWTNDRSGIGQNQPTRQPAQAM